MIEVEEIFLQGATYLAPNLVVIPEKNDKNHPADLIIDYNGHKFRENKFCEIRYNSIKNCLMPLVSFIRWRGLFIAMGLRRWLLFWGCGERSSVELHRLECDDNGFYVVNFYEVNDILVSVYEGGLLAISRERQILWHIKKYWDDIVVSVDSDEIMFESEAGGVFSVSSKTGKYIPR